MKYAYVIVLDNDKYYIGALTVVYSLKKVLQ